jgi:hypothetical protein
MIQGMELGLNLEGGLGPAHGQKSGRPGDPPRPSRRAPGRPGTAMSRRTDTQLAQHWALKATQVS